VGIGSLAKTKKAVFLDRDGVLNQAVVRNGKPFPPASVAEMIVNPEAETDLPRLKEMGFLLIVVTNQPDVGRGTQSRAVVEELHDKLRAVLPLDDFFVCYHDNVDQCNCRKPAPGLLLDAAARHSVSLPDSFLIGDRWRDVDAGARAGTQTVLIDYGYEERGPENAPTIRVTSLRDAVDWIVRRCDTI
jgi:D-glycero-D-manno-heptose 1,7-bisphosphate phosphatase